MTNILPFVIVRRWLLFVDKPVDDPGHWSKLRDTLFHPMTAAKSVVFAKLAASAETTGQCPAEDVRGLLACLEDRNPTNTLCIKHAPHEGLDTHTSLRHVLNPSVPKADLSSIICSIAMSIGWSKVNLTHVLLLMDDNTGYNPLQHKVQYTVQHKTQHNTRRRKCR